MPTARDDVPTRDIGARALWRRIEPIHAVTYFAPECRNAAKGAGLSGFWMGYFTDRTAPLGPVGPEVVTAIFFNFHPEMVARSIPDAWSLVKPGDVLRMRRAAAAEALRLRIPSVEALAATVGQILDRVVTGADGSGRACSVPIGSSIGLTIRWRHCGRRVRRCGSTGEMGTLPCSPPVDSMVVRRWPCLPRRREWTASYSARIGDGLTTSGPRQSVD